MNKKGFTLVELLATIAIIAIISLIAVPNIINTTENIKKQNMLDDAKRLISLAKQEVNANYDIRNENSHVFTFDSLNEKGDIKNDPDGESYDNSSYVRYYKENDIVRYCIYLKGSKRSIGKSDLCIEETDLYSKDIVKDNNM